MIDRKPVSVGWHQCGASLITAVFLLVLLAGLAALMASILSATHVNFAADVGGSRAYQAANAGVEWGISQLDPNGITQGLPSCPATITITTIPGQSVEVSCEVFPKSAPSYQEGSKTIRIFQFVSTATAQGVRKPGIERQVMATVEKCRDTAITAAPYDC